MKMKLLNISAVTKDYFKIQFFVLKCVGITLNPLEKTTRDFIYKFYMVFIIALVYIYFPFTEIHALVTDEDFESATNNLAFLLTQILGLIKITLLMLFRKKIRRFCQHIETHPFIPDRNRGGDIEFVYVGKAIRSCNIQGFVFYGLAIGTVVQLLCYAFTSPVRIKTIFNPITNITTIKQTRALPFNCKLPFDTAKSPYFEIVSVTGTILGGSYGFSIGSMDAIICGIMCHIRAQLLILKECLRTFIQRAIYLMKQDSKLSEFDSKMLETISKNAGDVEEIPSILQRYVRIAVCQIIEHHQKVINLAKDTDDVFSLLMLTQFLFSLGILCFMLFQLSLTPVKSFHFFGMTCYLFLMLFQLYLYCYRGNEIIIHSHNITDEIFGSWWFLADVSTQKMLLTMMTRTCRPIRMTAGKFVYLSLEAFMSIVRGSGSYFMVLKNTNAPRTDP